MIKAKSERLATCLTRYDQCLNGKFQYADSLVATFCCERGLWRTFCRTVTQNYGRITQEQIGVRLLGFLHLAAQEALELCRNGQNRFHDIHTILEACKYFTVIFCGIRTKYTLIGHLLKISRQDLELATLTSYEVLDISKDELRGLVLKFGMDYVERCRVGQISCAQDLAILGADYNLDIEELGSSAEEVQRWLFAADVKKVGMAFKELLEQPLHALMADSEHTAEHLEILINCLEPDECLDGKKLPWYMRAKPVTTNDLKFKPEDVEYIQRIRRELEAHFSP